MTAAEVAHLKKGDHLLCDHDTHDPATVIHADKNGLLLKWSDGTRVWFNAHECALLQKVKS